MIRKVLTQLVYCNQRHGLRALIFHAAAGDNNISHNLPNTFLTQCDTP